MALHHSPATPAPTFFLPEADSDLGLLPGLVHLAQRLCQHHEDGSTLAALGTISPPQNTAAPQAPDNKEETAVEMPANATNSAPQPVALKPTKKKTGRKPSLLTCFLCPSILPYKCTLILHLQTVHHIDRSQSLMYKRVNQGGEDFKRRYIKEAPEPGEERSRS